MITLNEHWDDSGDRHQVGVDFENGDGWFLLKNITEEPLSVIIDLFSARDPYLKVFDSEENLLETDDDGGEGRNSQIIRSIELDDFVYIFATTYSPNFKEEDYTLSISSDNTTIDYSKVEITKMTASNLKSIIITGEVQEYTKEKTINLEEISSIENINYSIEMKKSSENNSSYTEIKTISGKITSIENILIENLEVGEEYNVRVKSTNIDDSEFVYSNIFTFVSEPFLILFQNKNFAEEYSNDVEGKINLEKKKVEFSFLTESIFKEYIVEVYLKINYDPAQKIATYVKGKSDQETSVVSNIEVDTGFDLLFSSIVKETKEGIETGEVYESSNLLSFAIPVFENIDIYQLEEVNNKLIKIKLELNNEIDLEYKVEINEVIHELAEGEQEFFVESEKAINVKVFTSNTTQAIENFFNILTGQIETPIIENLSNPGSTKVQFDIIHHKTNCSFDIYKSKNGTTFNLYVSDFIGDTFIDEVEPGSYNGYYVVVKDNMDINKQNESERFSITSKVFLQKYLDTNLQEGKKYFYKIKGVKNV